MLFMCSWVKALRVFFFFSLFLVVRIFALFIASHELRKRSKVKNMPVLSSRQEINTFNLLICQDIIASLRTS